MTDNRFERPRPDWNILKRLGQIADGFDENWKRISSPAGTRTGDDPIPDTDTGAKSPARPVPVRNSVAPICRIGCDYVIGGARSDEVRQSPTRSGVDSGDEEVWA